jgi:hypothetical protein
LVILKQDGSKIKPKTCKIVKHCAERLKHPVMEAWRKTSSTRMWRKTVANFTILALGTKIGRVADVKSLSIRLTKTIHFRCEWRGRGEKNATKLFLRRLQRCFIAFIMLHSGMDFHILIGGWKYIWEGECAFSGFGRGLGIACKSHDFALQVSLRS